MGLGQVCGSENFSSHSTRCWTPTENILNPTDHQAQANTCLTSKGHRGCSSHPASSIFQLWTHLLFQEAFPDCLGHCYANPECIVWTRPRDLNRPCLWRPCAKFMVPSLWHYDKVAETYGEEVHRGHGAYIYDICISCMYHIYQHQHIRAMMSCAHIT